MVDDIDMIPTGEISPIESSIREKYLILTSGITSWRLEAKHEPLLEQGFQEDSQLQKIIMIFILIQMRWFKDQNAPIYVHFLGKILSHAHKSQIW